MDREDKIFLIIYFAAIVLYALLVFLGAMFGGIFESICLHTVFIMFIVMTFIIVAGLCRWDG